MFCIKKMYKNQVPLNQIFLQQTRVSITMSNPIESRKALFLLFDVHSRFSCAFKIRAFRLNWAIL